MSLSVTTTLIVYGASFGRLSSYLCAGAVNDNDPAGRWTSVGHESSPHVIVTTCESSVPGSAKLPLKTTSPPSSIEVALKLSEGSVGGTLSTGISIVVLGPAPGPVSSTVTVAIYGNSLLSK